MTDLVDYGIAFISKVIEVCDDVKENKAKSRCLQEQWVRVQQNISRANTGASSYKKSLDAMRALADETIAFLSKFKHKSYVRKAWNHSSDKGTFEDLSKRLNVLMQEMQLGCALDTQELLASHARSHTVDVGEIGKSIAESEARLAESQKGMESRLLAALRNAEEAARQRGGGAAVVADEVRKQVSEALAHQSRELNRTLNARSQADQAEVQQLLLETKQGILSKLAEAGSLPNGVSEEALQAALRVERGDIVARFEQLEAVVKEQGDRVLHGQAEIKDMIAILQDVASPRRTKRQSLTARLDEISSADVEELEQIGEGSFGQVMKARFQGHFVAMKKIKSALMSLSPKGFESLKKEAATMQSLNHWCIIRIWGMCTAPTNAFILVEYADAGTFSEYVCRLSGHPVQNLLSDPSGYFFIAVPGAWLIFIFVWRTFWSC